jgi:hypothetical protein
MLIKSIVFWFNLKIIEKNIEDDFYGKKKEENEF